MPSGNSVPSHGVVAAIWTSCVAFALMQAPHTVLAQTLVPDTPSCARCEIVLTEVAQLGDDEQAFLASVPHSVGVDNDGRYWITSWRRLPLLFDPTGHFLRKLGSIGDGPDEFRDPANLLFVPGDSIVVFDANSLRATVITSDLRMARSVRLGGDLTAVAVIRWPDSVLVSGRLPAPAPAGQYVHLVSLVGTEISVITSSTSDVEPPDQPQADAWLLSSAGSGFAWAASTHLYRLYQLAAGRLPASATLERRPPWFVPGPVRSIGTPTSPPPSAVHAVSQDVYGRLWVYSRVASESWRDAWPKLREGTLEVAVSAIEMDKLLSTMVEVIDPIAGRVLARRQLPGLVISAMSSDRLAVYHVGADALPLVKVFRLSLVQQGG